MPETSGGVTIITIDQAVQLSRVGTFIPALPAGELADTPGSAFSYPGDSGVALWVDARSAEEYRLGHVPGAMPLQAARWEIHLMEVVRAWNPGDTLVVYGGDTAFAVAQRLDEQTQLEPIVVLDGGWEVAYRKLQP